MEKKNLEENNLGTKVFFLVFKTGIDIIYRTSPMLAKQVYTCTFKKKKNLVCLKSLVSAQETLGMTRNYLMSKTEMH